MTAKDTPEPQLFTVAMAAKMLGVGRTTAWKFITDGVLESVHIGRRRMVRASSLRSLIANGTTRPGAA